VPDNPSERRRDNNESCANAKNEKIYVKMSVFVCQQALDNDIFAIFASASVISVPAMTKLNISSRVSRGIY
jgi:hypothetical protein